MDDPIHLSSHALLVVRVTSYLLGVAVILDAMVSTASTVQWVTGLILVGVIPPEAVLARLVRPLLPQQDRQPHP